MTTIVGYEGIVDTVIDVFLKALDERFAGKPNKDGVIDLYAWFAYFTFDVMGSMSYGGRHGFLESGEDVHGIIGYVTDFLTYNYFVSQLSLLYWDV